MNNNDIYKSYPYYDPMYESISDNSKTVDALPRKVPNQHELGVKLDEGKLRVALVYEGFKDALNEVWKDGTFGANKYTDNGWQTVPNGRNRYLDAMFRHLNSWLAGETLDNESQVHHLGAAAWNILAVLQLELTQEKENG